MTKNNVAVDDDYYYYDDDATLDKMRTKSKTENHVHLLNSQRASACLTTVCRLFPFWPFF